MTQNSGTGGTSVDVRKGQKSNKRQRRAEAKAKQKDAGPKASLETDLAWKDPKKIKFGDRARTKIDIEDLLESVEEKGIIQPITVDPNDNLIAGGRRLTAALKLGLELIPCLVRPVQDAIDFYEIELIENVQREDLNWLDRTRLVAKIDRLYKDRYGESAPGPGGGWSSRKTAELLARSHGSVQRTLALAKGLEIIPDLDKCKTENEAFKQLKKLEEAILVKQLRKKQDALIDEHDDEETDPDVLAAEQEEQELTDEEILAKVRAKRLSQAKANFRIGNALDGLKELADLYSTKESVIRFLEVDPPFGISLQQKKKRSNKDAPSTLDKYEEIDADRYVAFLQEICPLLYAITAEDSWLAFWYGPTWTAEVRESLEAANWHVDHIPAVWVKGEEESSGTGQTGSPERYLGRATEFFFVGRKGKPLLAREGRTNVFNHKPVPLSQKYHPTQKPVPLYEDILTTFCFPSTVLCSPFLGSGAVLRAAVAQSMTGFGWDLNEKNRDRFLIALQEDEDE